MHKPNDGIRGDETQHGEVNGIQTFYIHQEFIHGTEEVQSRNNNSRKFMQQNMCTITKETKSDVGEPHHWMETHRCS